MVLRARKRISSVPLVPVIGIVEIIASVRLHDRQAGLGLVVLFLWLVDFPDQQSFARKIEIEAGLLSVLEQQILLRLEFRAHDPEHLPGGRRVRLDRQFLGCGDRGPADPSMLQLVQRRGMGRPRTIAIIGSARHQIPYAGAVPVGSVFIVIRIVEILPLEGEVAEFMRANTDLAVVWNDQIDRSSEIGPNLDRIF